MAFSLLTYWLFILDSDGCSFLPIQRTVLLSMAFVVLFEFVGGPALIPDSFYLKVQVGDVMSRKEKNLLHLSLSAFTFSSSLPTYLDVVMCCRCVAEQIKLLDCVFKLCKQLIDWKFRKSKVVDESWTTSTAVYSC